MFKLLVSAKPTMMLCVTTTNVLVVVKCELLVYYISINVVVIAVVMFPVFRRLVCWWFYFCCFAVLWGIIKHLPRNNPMRRTAAIFLDFHLTNSLTNHWLGRGYSNGTRIKKINLCGQNNRDYCSYWSYFSVNFGLIFIVLLATTRSPACHSWNPLVPRNPGWKTLYYRIDSLSRSTQNVDRQDVFDGLKQLPIYCYQKACSFCVST